MSRAHVHFATGLPSSASGGGGGGTPEAKAQANDGEGILAIKTLDIASTEGTKGGQNQEEKVVAEEEQVISGMRSTADALVWVDVRRSAQEGGLQWWKSENGVVLTEGNEKGMVGLEWIVRVEKRATGEVIWRPSGEKNGDKDTRGGR